MKDKNRIQTRVPPCTHIDTKREKHYNESVDNKRLHTLYEPVHRSSPHYKRTDYYDI